MADRYIDQDETQIYGPYAKQKIVSVVIPLAPEEFKPALHKLAAELESSTQSMGQILEQSRGARLQVQDGSAQKATVMELASSTLSRFSKHLDTHKAGVLNRRAFFPEDGTASGVGRTPVRYQLALSRISTLLADAKSPVENREKWLGEITATMQAMQPVLAYSESAHVGRAAATPQVEAARTAWLKTYGAAKLVVEGVLTLSGHLHLLTQVFYDLALPGSTKVTEPPPETTPGPTPA